MILPALVGLGTFGAGVLLTLAAEHAATRAGVVARPRGDRWHRQQVPLMGGAAIAMATVVAILVTVRDGRLTALALTACGMAAVGFIDDLRVLSPRKKLVAEAVLATVLIQFGFVVQVTGHRWADVLLTLFWLVGITNAFNLLDNMDGLAAGTALIATTPWLLLFHLDGNGGGVAACAIFLGAVAGFLVRNAPPARIFMGDSGSLFLGFFLAGLSLVPIDHADTRGPTGFAIPVLILLVPIFDTTFVTITRLLAGQSPAVGGRDHISHRLVAAGFSERQTVLLLILLSVATGSVALLTYGLGVWSSFVILALLMLGLVVLGLRLRRVDARTPRAARRRSSTIARS